MNSYHNSEYRTAEKRYICARCDRGIPKGAQYLDYIGGQGNHLKICDRCSVKYVRVGPLAGRLQYNVRAVRQRVGKDE